jgi:hypothetical protein
MRFCHTDALLFAMTASLLALAVWPRHVWTRARGEREVIGVHAAELRVDRARSGVRVTERFHRATRR